VVVLPGEGVYLFGERGSAVLRGPVYERLAPLLDNSRTVDDLVEALAASTPASEIYYAIDRMIAGGYVCDGHAAAAPEAEGFWSALGVDPVGAVSRLRATAVAVRGVGAVDLAPLVAALGGAGLSVAPDWALTIVAADDYLRQDLDAINTEALASGRPWLLCKPTGSILWVGPLFRPGESACWKCLAHRLRDHRGVETAVTGTSDPLVLPRSAVPGSESIALGLAALHAARAIASPGEAADPAAVVTFDLRTLVTDRHVVVKLPQCVRCGQPLDRHRAPEPPRLRGPAVSPASGDHVVAPETTFARYRHHVSPITGLVSDLQAAPVDARSPIHVWRASQGTAWGKGPTAAHARTAALCEALEMMSGRFRGDEPRVRATYRALGDRAIHPNACMLFSDRQYAHREVWNASAGWFRYIPEPFDEDAEIDWVHVWSMTHETFKFLPAEYCYYGRQERPAGSFADPNGQGAGNTLEDAILHALLELVERDAVAIWWYNRIRRPAVDFDGFDDPLVQAMRRYAAHERRDLWALNLTTDLGIPVVVAASRARESAEHISFGFGAALDPRVALVRALGEMQQLARTFAEAKDRRLREWWHTATLADHPYLAPNGGDAPAWKPADQRFGDAATSIGECRRRLEQQELEVLVIDQTRPDIGLPTARVVVPGLRHWRPPRCAPGRLYDVPVRLGWLASPLGEDELNPLFPPA
jgi:bacteriocin biosynthesis cyclodehydratase domain-containing protein